MGTALAPVGKAIEGFGSVSEGYATQAGYEHDARKARRAATAGGAAASQTDTFFREELQSTLATIDVMRAAAGVVPTSPTGMAIRDEQTRVAARQRVTQVSNLRNQAVQSDADARALTYAGYAAVDAGWLKGLSSFAAAASSVFGGGSKLPIPGA
jgi:hypothetical protein